MDCKIYRAPNRAFFGMAIVGIALLAVYAYMGAEDEARIWQIVLGCGVVLIGGLLYMTYALRISEEGIRITVCGIVKKDLPWADVVRAEVDDRTQDATESFTITFWDGKGRACRLTSSVIPLEDMRGISLFARERGLLGDE